MNELEKLLDRHRACQDAREWIRQERLADPAEAWERCQNPEWLLWAVRKLDLWDDDQWNSFVLYCVQLVAHLLADPCSRAAWKVAECYTQGKATLKELAAANEQAWIAYADAPCSTDSEAAHKNACYVAYSVSRLDSRGLVFHDCCREVVLALTYAGTHSTAEVWTAQANKIRELWPNPFKGEPENNDKRRVKA